MKYVLTALFLCLNVFALATPTTSRADHFIQFIAPLAQKANAQVLQNRQRLLGLYQLFKTHQALGTPNGEWLAGLANYYKLNRPDFSQDATWQQLLRRVNVIPSSLVIAQAAMESGWGKSRFAQHCNYFGMRCYTKGCGIVPKGRPKGAVFCVTKFASPATAVQAYIHNLNTQFSYVKLRQMRQAMVAAGKPLSGYALAAGLDRYSETDGYVGLIRKIIQKYDLSRYDSKS